MPNSRKEFERNMSFLAEGFERDQVMISESSIRTIRGIKNARLAPNNRANLMTIDEMVRVTANSIFSMRQRQNFKQDDHE